MSPDQSLAHLREHGYVVLPEALSGEALEGARSTLQSYFDVRARGGDPWLLVHSLVGRGQAFEDSVLDETVCSLASAVLGADLLLTASVGICQQPLQPAGPVHHDDGCYPLPRPRSPLSVSALWALDDFTADNGAVEILFGSHLWDADRAASAMADGAESVPMLMSAGSCLVILGTLLHRAGANRTGAPRRGFTNEYCLPWLRPQENFLLTLRPASVAQMPSRLRSMLGYAEHPPSFGHIGLGDPELALEPDYVAPLEADERAIASGTTRRTE